MIKKILPLPQSQPDKHKEVPPDNSTQKSVCNKYKRTFETHKDCNSIKDHARKNKSLNQT